MGVPRYGPLTPSPDAPVLLVALFTATDLTSLRRKVAQRATAFGLHGERLDDFVFAVYEVLTNAVRHGGGTGSLRLEHVDGNLVCQVDDDGPGFSPEALSARPPTRAGGRGLRLAKQLTDALTITRRAPGTSVRIHVATG